MIVLTTSSTEKKNNSRADGSLRKPRNVPAHSFKAEELGQPFEPWAHGWGLEHFDPTLAPPGSFAKVAVLEERLRCGLPLWHPKDGDTSSAGGVSPEVLLSTLEGIVELCLTKSQSRVRRPKPARASSARPLRARVKRVVGPSVRSKVPDVVSPSLTPTRSDMLVTASPSTMKSVAEARSEVAQPSGEDNLLGMLERTRLGVQKGILQPSALNDFMSEHREALEATGLKTIDLQNCEVLLPRSFRQLSHAPTRDEQTTWMPTSLDTQHVTNLLDVRARLERLVESGVVHRRELDDFNAQHKKHLDTLSPKIAS